MRLITILKHGTKVYYNRDYGEYIVKPYKSEEPSWYYCDDKQDAIDTANMIERGTIN